MRLIDSVSKQVSDPCFFILFCGHMCVLLCGLMVAGGPSQGWPAWLKQLVSKLVQLVRFASAEGGGCSFLPCSLSI